MTELASVSCQQLLNYCDELLQPASFKDYCPNGLQIEGKQQITRLISGVTASQALLDAAVQQQADAILVHHGYFWRNETATIVGMRKQRIHTLLRHDINLIAYHLPLDAHKTLGNNAQLASQLKVNVDGVVSSGAAKHLLFHGHMAQSYTVDDLAVHINACLNRQPLVIAAADKPIQRIAWCTGAAQHYIHEAAELGVDAFISGEISESTTHVAKELNIHYFAAGHHATERYGVQALGHHLAEKFAIKHEFIDINNPV